MERIDCEKCHHSEFEDVDKLRCRLKKCQPEYDDMEKECIRTQKCEQLKAFAGLIGKATASVINKAMNCIKTELEARQREQLIRQTFGILEESNLDEWMFLESLRSLLNEEHPSLAELREQVEEIDELGPSPTEIKRRLKYAKNQMEIKRLNRQLAISYKKYKKRETDRRKRTMASKEDMTCAPSKNKY